MRVRALVLGVVLIGAALGTAAGCSSGASSGGKAPLGPPTGTVTVRSGNKFICTITLNKDGTGTCKVSTAGYNPGQVTYTGTYNGGNGYMPGPKASTTLTIVPAKQAGPVVSSPSPAAT
jgi:hypothetical protein